MWLKNHFTVLCQIDQIFYRKPRWERWVFARFISSLVFLLCFFIAKIPRFKSNQKNQSCEKNLGQVHSGLFLCIFLVFVRVFCCPKPNCPKTRGKPKKPKKANPVRRILGKSIQDCFCLFFFGFSRVFCCPKPKFPKTRGKPKKQKKTNPLGEESWVSPFRIVFFCFSRGFCCPKPNCPKTRGKQKKTKKPIL